MATNTDQAPSAVSIAVRVPAALAADATLDVAIGKAPFAGVVSAVEFVPDSVLTGADTNSATLAAVNKGQAGAGTLVPASKAFTNGVNAPAFDSTALTLSVTATDLDVAAGDEFAYRRTKVGTGLATPAGVFRVTFTRA